MSEQAKITKGSSKRFRSLLLITILLVTTALVAGAAATVVSRQNAKLQNAKLQKASAREGGIPVADNAGKNLVTVEVAGQQVQVDSQTGQIQDLTPEEARKLAEGLKPMLNRSTEGLEKVQHEDGSVSVDLDGRFQDVTVAKVGKDGKVTESCVNNPKAAAAFFGIDAKQIENAKPSTKVSPAKNQN